MRRIVIILAVAVLAPSCLGQTNRDARVSYVLQNLGVNRETQKKLRPLLQDYLSEKKEASSEYTALKGKLKAGISAETLTNEQATSLLTKKWAAEAKETAVKRKYTEKFQTVLSAKKTYKCFDLLNDSKSKVQGKQKTKGADDDD